jgi:hypothetical protein
VILDGVFYVDQQRSDPASRSFVMPVCGAVLSPFMPSCLVRSCLLRSLLRSLLPALLPALPLSLRLTTLRCQDYLAEKLAQWPDFSDQLET